jgi:hypothetical protein
MQDVGFRSKVDVSKEHWNRPDANDCDQRLDEGVTFVIVATRALPSGKEMK